MLDNTLRYRIELIQIRERIQDYAKEIVDRMAAKQEYSAAYESMTLLKFREHWLKTELSKNP